LWIFGWISGWVQPINQGKGRQSHTSSPRPIGSEQEKLYATRGSLFLKAIFSILEYIEHLFSFHRPSLPPITNKDEAIR
jgi:hypothetical protein